MATISVTSNAATVGLWFDRKAGEVKLFGAAASSVVAKAAHTILTPLLREEAPKQSGALAAGLRATTEIVSMGARLGFADDVPYAGFVLHGTGVYFDKGGHSAWDVDKYQAFSVQGTMVYTRHTHHEGQHPNDFVGRAMLRAEPELAVAMRLVGDKLYAMLA